MRQDIQALRGWAVLIVLIDHAHLGILNSGFLGVDIFFVISGFLITSIISNALNKNSFSLGEFYFKRARRILPAAFATIILTAFLAIFSITSTEIESLTNQIYGALTYTINFVLWSQVDYFDVAAKSKPLLHMWSLAVEEQFYLFLPIILLFTAARHRLKAALAITIVSFIFCLYWVKSDSTGAYYLLHTRAWELGIGVVLALISDRSLLIKKISALAFYPALFLLIAIPFLPFKYTHPGFMALLVCVAAAVFISANNENIARFTLTKILARIGNISYSLYLVHWPIMVFFYSGYLGEAPKLIALATIPLSFLTAYLMYKYVEKPCLNIFSKPSFKYIFIVLGSSAAVALISLLFLKIAKPSDDISKFRLPNYGLSQRCDFTGQAFEPRKECSNHKSPDTLVWGDSFAMHVVPGMSQQSKIVQATYSTCAPIFNQAPKSRRAGNVRGRATLCINFNNDVFAFLKDSPHIKTVVLSSPWRLEAKPGGVLFSKTDSGLIEIESGLNVAIEAMGKTINEILKLDKKIIIFGPPPVASRDTSACLEKVATGKVIFESICKIDAVKALKDDINITTLLGEMDKIDGVKVINLSDTLCNKIECITHKGSTPIYRDRAHLSVEGSKVVFKMIDLDL